MIYTYGCLPPIDGLGAIDAELRRAHRYRNGLVEIERRRRERIKDVQVQHDRLGPLLVGIDHVETQIAAWRQEAKGKRSGVGKRADVSPLRAKITEWRCDLAVLRWLRGWQKAVLKGDATLKAGYGAAQNQSYAEVRALRNGDESPYWGTYLIVEKAAEAWKRNPDAPRYLPYRGEGRLAVQLQKGLPVADLLAGTDMRLRILPGTSRARRDGSLRPFKDTFRTVKLRIGSNGRAPLWVTLPMVMHRPPPEDGLVKWAWLRRTRVGVRFRYELQVIVESEAFAPPAPSDPGEAPLTVAVDIGTRDLPSGDLRVAYWVDSQGKEGEILLPRTRLSSPASHGHGRRRVVPDDLGKVEDLRAIRDKHLDDIKVQLAAHRRVAITAEWFQERTSHVDKWRSPARVGALYRDWQRHEGDEEIHAALGEYLRRDRHLYDWEVHERRRHVARRDDLYRRLAADFCGRYQTIVIAGRDYRREELPPEEAVSTTGHENRTLMRSAAPGKLVAAIKQAAAKRGAAIVQIEIEGDTSWALDRKVCARLLASVEVMPDGGRLLAQSIHAPPLPKSAQGPRRRRLGTAERVDPLANEDVSP
jgi:hypothetical protein